VSLPDRIALVRLLDPGARKRFFGPQVTGTSAWPSGPGAVAGACESETASGLWMLEADPSGQNPLPVIR